MKFRHCLLMAWVALLISGTMTACSGDATPDAKSSTTPQDAVFSQESVQAIAQCVQAAMAVKDHLASDEAMAEPDVVAAEDSCKAAEKLVRADADKQTGQSPATNALAMLTEQVSRLASLDVDLLATSMSNNIFAMRDQTKQLLYYSMSGPGDGVNEWASNLQSLVAANS